MKSVFIKGLVICFCSLSMNSGITVCYSDDNSYQEKLDTILAECAEYCETLENASLDFVCKEEIKERLFYTRGFPSLFSRQTRFFKENTYVYDYQLVRKDNSISERRILIKENGREKHEENAILKTEMFEHKYVVMGPIGLLSDNWQKQHDFKILGEEEFREEKAVVNEATPRDSLESDRLYGRIWVKKGDSSILKIEWNQKSMGHIEKIEEFAHRIKAKPLIVFTSEYNVEKKGIRFPSRYFVKESYILDSGVKITRSETTVDYSDYKFFTVETDVVIK